MRAHFLVTLCGTASAVTPIEKVLTMMEDIKQKAIAEQKDEQVKISRFNQWSQDTQEKKEKAIKTANERIEVLEGTIMKEDAIAAQMAQEIAEHQAEFEKQQGIISATQKDRKQTAEDFRLESTDLNESIDALNRAIKVLKARTASAAQAEALVQEVTKLRKVAPHRSALQALLQEPGVAHGYEFQSGGVIDLMEKILADFRKELTTATMEEQKSKSAHEMTIQKASDLSERMTADIGRKTKAKATAEKKSGEAAEEKESTIATRDEDITYLKETQLMTDHQNRAFKQRQTLREEEIEVIGKAIEIIGNPEVAQGATYLPSLVQASLVQMSSRRGITDFLESVARKYDSRDIELISAAVQADPFVKVRGMIQDMITKLKDEAKAELEHHGWCQKELKESKADKEGSEQKIESLNADIDDLKAKIASSKQNKEDLLAQIKDTETSRAEASEVRASNKAKNEKTIAESKAAIEAVASALELLQSFYAKAKKATAGLLQAPSDDAPVTIDTGAYTGAAQGGVVGMVEVIQTDFIRLQTETEQTEAQETTDHKKFMNDSQILLAKLDANVKNAASRIAMNTKNLEEKTGDLTSENENYDGIMKRWNTLQTQCVKAPVSYEDRVAQREAEMEDLKQALQMLEDGSKQIG